MKIAAKLGLAVLLAFAVAACQTNDEKPPTTTHKWAWASGAETVNQTGVYGTQGTAAAANVPGSREGAVSWRDPAGKFWLFGGYGFDGQGFRDRLNDLWTYDPTASTWTWISGGDTIDQPGSYGTRGAASPANVPGARNGSVSWTDAAGNLWLFGGLGYAGTDALVHLNDLWEFDMAAHTWTWVSGSNAGDRPGVYGTLGSPGASNAPGSRLGAVSGVGADGRLWLFGGFGHDADGVEGWLNDLWVFDPATRQWAWISGSDAGGQKGVYGTKGTAAAANVPGGRYISSGWIDPGGHVWIFGGEGLDSTGARGPLNDLWRYDPEASQWTWFCGAQTINGLPTYGTVDVADSNNTPGARVGSTAWTDSQGKLWLFGGYGYEAASAMRWLNDLWMYDPDGPKWMWVSGSATGGASGTYGTKGTAETTNVPGARYSAVPWIDTPGRLWFFGGYGADSAGTGGWLNDVWAFTK